MIHDRYSEELLLILMHVYSVYYCLNYLKLLYSTPSGLLMTGRVTTNYLQLMNIYQQRHNHRLPEWREFCQQLVDELPLFKEFLIANGQLKDDKGSIL